MKTQQDTTLLIPAYNPSDGWELFFYDRYLDFCRAIDQNVNVVLINDGSFKDITDAVEFLKTKLGNHFSYLSYNQNKGKGFALKFGARSSHSAAYIFTDIDFPYSTESMKNIWTAIQSSKGIVIGQRETNYYSNLSSMRSFLSKGLRKLNKLMINLPVNDTQCGLKAFDNEVKDILLQCQTDRFLIDLELLLAVNKKSISILPVTVTLRDGIDFTKFNSGILLKEFLNFIKLIWKYRLKN